MKTSLRYEPLADMLESDQEALAIPVNCEGVMGAGLARSFKQRHPEAFVTYNVSCRMGTLTPGTVSSALIFDKPTIRTAIFVPTKMHWRNPSTVVLIETSLKALKEFLVERSVAKGPLKSLAIPKLGCGLGNLSWDVVGPMVLSFVESLDDSVVESVVVYSEPIKTLKE